MAKSKSYEEASARLEEIVVTLENGDLPLEEALKLFEEGTKLSAYCYKILKNAEQKVTVLTAKEEQ
ncbi:MAG TPA: exodeoxyribonuclease VII small subunit [Clostridiales bacterium]|nr:exodeoxyribonuclease VII small subunit [Clostridiales bacterium]